MGRVERANEKLTKTKSFNGLTRAVAIDCEMVGVGYDGKDSMLARVSIVNYFGHCVYDKYVAPQEEVKDYRTKFSGIRPIDIKDGEDFRKVQEEVYNIIKDRLLVGHSLENDMKALLLSHPRSKMRDTAYYFKRKFGGRTPSLRKLTQLHLGVVIQDGEHDSIQDAKAAMRLYTKFKKEWERDIKTRFARVKRPNSAKEKVKRIKKYYDFCN